MNRLYPISKSYLYAYLVSAALILFARTLSLHAAEVANNFDTLTTLLKELREIRQAKHELVTQWKDEKEQLNLIKDLEAEKLEMLQKEKKAATETLTDLNDNLFDTERQDEVVAESASHLREWIEDNCQSLLNHVSKYSILIKEDQQKGIHNILKKETATTDKLVLYLNLLLETAMNGTKAKVGRRTIDLDGSKYSVNVLTLGGILEYFITPDNSLCGFRHAGGSNENWDKLDKNFAESIRTAIQVVDGEVPPKIVSVPVPQSVIKGGAE